MKTRIEIALEYLNDISKIRYTVDYREYGAVLMAGTQDVTMPYSKQEVYHIIRAISNYADMENAR